MSKVQGLSSGRVQGGSEPPKPTILFFCLTILENLQKNYPETITLTLILTLKIDSFDIFTVRYFYLSIFLLVDILFFRHFYISVYLSFDIFTCRYLMFRYFYLSIFDFRHFYRSTFLWFGIFIVVFFDIFSFDQSRIYR